MTDEPRPESLEETARRLAAYGSTGGGPEVMPPYDPSQPPQNVPVQPPTQQPHYTVPPGYAQQSPQQPHQYSSPQQPYQQQGSVPPYGMPPQQSYPGFAPQSYQPPRRRGGLIALFIAVGVVIVLVIAGGIVGLVVVRHNGSPAAAGSRQSVAGWTGYPGVSSTKSSVVLANPSMEEASAKSDQFLSDYRAALTTALGLDWSVSSDKFSVLEDNGYGGKSMLYGVGTPIWEGTVTLNDPSARQKVKDVFDQLTKKYGVTNKDDTLFDNDFLKDDKKSSLKEFGAATLDQQPMWQFSAFDGIAKGCFMMSRVLDLNLPRDPSFDSGTFFDLDNKDTFHVTAEVDCNDMLPAADRDKFQQALKGYDESKKPQPK